MQNANFYNMQVSLKTFFLIKGYVGQFRLTKKKAEELN